MVAAARLPARRADIAAAVAPEADIHPVVAEVALEAVAVAAVPAVAADKPLNANL